MLWKSKSQHTKRVTIEEKLEQIVNTIMISELKIAKERAFSSLENSTKK